VSARTWYGRVVTQQLPLSDAIETPHVQAHDYRRALALLPIDPEIDARVEALAKAHEPTKGAKRTLPRKR
jgi:hypothetical protein